MTQRNTGVILLALLLAAMVIVPMVSAEKNMAGKIIRASATQEQVDKINELWGKDITAGEYFEQIHPEFLVDMPAEIKEKLYQKKWIWPISPDMETKSQSRSLLLLPITCQGSLHAHTAVIHFAGTAQYSVVPPLSAPGYMAFATYLVNSADQVKASTAASGYSVTYLNSDNMWQPDASGSYHTHTTAFSLSPNYDAVPYHSGSITWP
jgi:hypothetical protein